jgi:DNA-binding XRE family transcriptional regulator
MSQWALAYEIDAAQETIHRIEVGRAKLVKPGHLRLLSDLFGVSIDELVYQMEM